MPVGLVPCAECGGWRGECLDPNPPCHGKVLRVQCRCENHNRCARCGEPFAQFRLNANHYDAGLGVIVHVPGFCALTHACAAPEGRRGRPGTMADLRALVCALVGICYDADTRQRFVAWLRSVRPTMAALAVMMVKMALRHTPVGEQAQSRYVLVGFQPDGEPLIDLRALS